MSLLPQPDCMLGRQVFVKQESHWSARTTSSAANCAAYCRLAVMCSDLSCGYARRTSSRVSPAASFSSTRYTGMRVPLRQGFPIITPDRDSIHSGNLISSNLADRGGYARLIGLRGRPPTSAFTNRRPNRNSECAARATSVKRHEVGDGQRGRDSAT